MKYLLIVTGVALLCTLSAMGVRAKPEYSGVVTKTHKLNATAAKALSCATCHVSSSNFARNPFGKQMEKEMGAKKDLTAAILEKIAKLDADGDGTSNEDEIKAGTNPGNPKSGAAKKKAEDEKKTPADDKKAPADEKKAPADEKKPADDKAAPADDKAAPADDKAAPADDKAAPADDKAAPADDKTAAGATAPVEDKTPADDKKPAADDKTQAEAKAPVDDK